MPVFYSPLSENLRVGLAHVGSSVWTSNRTAEHLGKDHDDHSGVNELVSHLPLQMLLYFNMFYFPCWWFSSVFMLQLKYQYLPAYYQGLLISGVVLLTLVEGLRLYLGYLGNLQEKWRPSSGPGTVGLLAADVPVPAAGASLLPDGRGDPHPASGAGRARPLPDLPTGPDPGRHLGAPEDDPQAHFALPPAPAGKSGQLGPALHARVRPDVPPQRVACVAHLCRLPLNYICIIFLTYNTISTAKSCQGLTIEITLFIIILHF
ncbi:uncharacterized protein LOC133631828 isoform X1 [Entelurus aequoreus]|uniref:uncharacterized protein LOC133631828 isoform X1 n=1 Tax=Entelurus aequoreus TaxID=161455 RepID=UPI002B1E40FE|nr:uncharacterized protein LOC133631828 isoform X1 [Entelurus aequoreus]